MLSLPRSFFEKNSKTELDKFISNFPKKTCDY